jgi:hypothetical protein
VRNPLALLPDLLIWQVVGPNVTTFLPIILLLAVAAGSLVVRARSAVGIERQQLRWFTSSVEAVVVAVIGGLLVSALLPALGTSGLVWIPAIVAFPLVPIAIGTAVLRYRLFEIDRIISRTIGYAIVTLTLVVVFAGAVVGLQAVLEPLLGGNTVAVAASTLIVAALFQPLRGRIQRAVDRRFDRARYDGERTVAAFAARLRDQVDLQSLEGELGEVVRRTIAPTTLGLWIQRQEAHE